MYCRWSLRCCRGIHLFFNGIFHPRSKRIEFSHGERTIAVRVDLRNHIFYLCIRCLDGFFCRASAEGVPSDCTVYVDFEETESTMCILREDTGNVVNDYTYTIGMNVESWNP